MSGRKIGVIGFLSIWIAGAAAVFAQTIENPAKQGAKDVRERLEWVQLGLPAQIDNDFFSHVFELRKKAGAFSKLELRMNGIFMLDLILVKYEDGTTWAPEAYPRFPIQQPHSVTLPDDGKKIKTVEIRYHDVGGPINKAAVSLWGGRPKKPKS
jgi:hypothetical protein